MLDATIIYPHQLFTEHPALKKGRQVFLVEEPLLLREYPIHSQKLLLHRLSMQAYRDYLQEAGFNITYLELSQLKNAGEVFELLAKHGVTEVHIVDTTDFYLEKRIAAACKAQGFTRVAYESPLFILSKDEAKTRYVNSKKHMARFYKSLRQDKKILVTGKGEPVGGQWSFDAENRQSLKKGVLIPNDPTWIDTQAVRDAKEWLTQQTVERYGAENVWIPYTHRDAEIWLQDFLTHRFVSFGAYEDALSETHVRLFHAAVSPLLNIGLLTPTQVLDSAMLYAKEHTVPLNSLEGFVRQILGWREFVRAAYECDGVTMRTKNFWNHTRKLSPGFWNGTTGLLPVDTAIKSALQFGYNHHIERLMVLGNSMVLLQTDPDEVYRWFMAMYVDAYDWVMVPNVYGMSQFADGGIFATKPYISGSNYIKKMSSYKKGVWEDIWTSLYWNFIATHETFFLNNHRLSMMPRLLTNMDPDKKAQHLKTATKYLSK